MLDRSGNVTTQIANTRVLIGGYPAPLLYVSATQINAIVPFEIAGRTQTTVQIESNSVVALPVFSQTVSEASPAIFTLDGSGTGQAAALNQDGSVNSASNPAAHGSIVTLFVTGVGAMQPQPADGSVPRAPSATPALPIRVRSVALIAPWQIQYAGDAPGLVEGAVQLNVLIPESLSAGAQSMLIQAGGAGTSPYTSVTIFTK